MVGTVQGIGWDGIYPLPYSWEQGMTHRCWEKIVLLGHKHVTSGQWARAARGLGRPQCPPRHASLHPSGTLRATGLGVVSRSPCGLNIFILRKSLIGSCNGATSQSRCLCQAQWPRAGHPVGVTRVACPGAHACGDSEKYLEDSAAGLEATWTVILKLLGLMGPRLCQ